MSIYDNTIAPTYLYIKQHSVTGLKYFGKTTNKDPYKYLGSGKHWLNHIKKHGKEFVETMWISEPYTNKELLIEYALNFSKENNIVESNEWANLILENGLDGGTHGRILSEETRQKISSANKGKPGNQMTEDNKAKLSAINKGKIMSDETKAKMSLTRKNLPDEIKEKISLAIAAANRTRIVSDETKAKISAARSGRTGRPMTSYNKEKLYAANKGKIMSDETKQKLRIANLGKKQSDESKAKISAANKGKIMSEYNKEKLYAVNKGRIMSVETKAKLSAINKGKIMSDETKAKISHILKNAPIVKCPHCSLEGKGGAMTRYHFDNCKKYQLNINKSHM